MTTQTYGSYTALTVTNLHSLASSQTVGWQSAVIDNRSTGAIDYEILTIFDAANTAAANDKSLYVYMAPAMNDGTNWKYADGGTGTLPSGTEGSYTISTTTNNLVLLKRVFYTATDQVMQSIFTISPVYGQTMPDGFSFIVINYSGAALAASGNVVAYKAIT